MTLSLKEYIWWSACSWINILEGILLMLSVPSGSMPAVFLLIWRINIWRDSLGHMLLNVWWRSKIYLCSASSSWSSRDFSTFVQCFQGEGRVSSVCWSLPLSKVMSEGNVAGCVLSHALVPELSFEVVYKAAGACEALWGCRWAEWWWLDVRSNWCWGFLWILSRSWGCKPSFLAKKTLLCLTKNERNKKILWAEIQITFLSHLGYSFAGEGRAHVILRVMRNASWMNWCAGWRRVIQKAEG